MLADATKKNELRVWPRSEELIEFSETLADASETHIIVTGPTGAGKSTLILQSFLNSSFASAYRHVTPFDDYVSFASALIASCECPDDLIGERLELSGLVKTFLAAPSNQITIGESLDRGDVLGAAKPILERITEFLMRVRRRNKAADPDRPVLYIFDQIERFLILMSRQGGGRGKFNAFELVFLRHILTLLRRDDGVRTVFILREDYLYKSVELLLQGVTKKRSDLDIFRIFMCYGINNETSKDAIKSVQEAFSQLKFTPEVFEDFYRATGLSTGMLSNTFMLQLTGYMIEHYYFTDSRVRDILEQKDRTPAKNQDQVLAIFFDYLVKGYPTFSLQSRALPPEIIRVILFTIATENRNTGLHVTADRVAALAHVPPDQTKQVFDYLIRAGIVNARPDRLAAIAGQTSNTPSIRFAHDILSDYVLKSEAMTFNADLRVSISRLSEEYVPNNELSLVKRWPDFIRDWSAPTVGVVALWIFYLYGAARLLHSPTCVWLNDTISPWLPGHVFFESVGCQNVWWYYLVTFSMHCVWVTYIYYLDRSYFNVVLRKSPLKIFGILLPIIGVFCGIALGASPRALVIPTFVVGTVMACLLIATSKTQAPRTQFAQMNSGWGLRTLINMVISVVMSILLVLAMSGDPQVLRAMGMGSAWSVALAQWLSLSEQDLLQGLWVNIAALVMFYFWWHIRERQQSPVAAAFRVALYDRSRASRGVVSSGTLINS